MAINSIENATKYSSELDKMFAQKSATGFLPITRWLQNSWAPKPL